MNLSGIMVVSLDFELYWGVRDKKTLHQYRENLLGVRIVIPKMLEIFAGYGIHATWAAVGFLFFQLRNDLLQGCPVIRPGYRDPKLNPYAELCLLGDNENNDPYHFGHSLCKLIASYPSQQIGSHTFSHYYCLADGQDIDTFEADLRAAIEIAKQHGLRIKSLVFPRNQVNKNYLPVFKKLGIQCYRGVQHSWMYQCGSMKKDQFAARAFRLIDAYLNLTGHNCYDIQSLNNQFPINLPASRYLRPYSPARNCLEPLRLGRILTDLTYAAQNRLIYHLWWHPHDFGRHIEENLSFLTKILDHYVTLRDNYGMSSLSMEELANHLDI